MRKVLAIAVLLLCAALPLAAQTRPAQTQSSAVSERCLGSPTAPVKIEVFSDYQCPACRSFYLDTMRLILQEYATTGRVCALYYEFPLQQHHLARDAARYAEAAGRIGPQQWVRVTEAIFLAQAQWTPQVENVASPRPTEAALQRARAQLEAVVAAALTPKEMALVRKSLADSASLDAAIDRDVAQGRSRNVTGTPTIFITSNGQTHRVNGPVQYAIFKQFIERLLAQR